MEKIHKKIKTKAWNNYVASVVSSDDMRSCCSNHYGWIFRKTDTSKVNLLERKTGILAQNWSRYRTGERDVGISTLKIVEQSVPGSFDVYSIGPDKAPLWTAMWSHDDKELWEVSRVPSARILHYQAYNSNHEYMIDFMKTSDLEIYYSALSEYYEDRIRTALCLLNIEDLAALIAAFRLARIRREANNFREHFGRYLKYSLRCSTFAYVTLRNYGIADYVNYYVNQQNPRPDKISLETPIIHRSAAISAGLDGLV